MEANILKILLLIGGISLGIQYHGNAQCENWKGHPKQSEAENYHTIYRQELKLENYQLAFEYWKKAYDIAPAADGRRDYHFMDGVKLYKWKYNNTSKEEEKKKFRKKVLKLYEQAAKCYRKKAIHLSRCQRDQSCYDVKAGQVLGRKGFDMYYTFNMARYDIYQTLKRSIELAGLQTEYIILTPMADAIATSFDRGQISAEEARSTHARLKEIAQHNIEMSDKYKEYYKQALASSENRISTVEDSLYDCQYFKDKFLPEFRQNPNDGDRIRYMYNKLIKQGCDENDPDLVDLKSIYEKFAQDYSDSIQRAREKRNPELAAKRLYDEGKYEQSIAKYKESIAKLQKEGGNMDKVANWYFRIASIEGRKLRRYSSARSYAYKAAKIRPNWGRPFMLIGDLYASSSGDCGDPWNQRLAILAAIDKYNKAKSLDRDVASEANSRIANYQSSKPTIEMGHMRNLEEGDTVEVGCWIGEKVTLRFK